MTVRISSARGVCPRSRRLAFVPLDAATSRDRHPAHTPCGRDIRRTSRPGSARTRHVRARRRHRPSSSPTETFKHEQPSRRRGGGKSDAHPRACPGVASGLHPVRFFCPKRVDRHVWLAAAAPNYDQAGRREAQRRPTSEFGVDCFACLLRWPRPQPLPRVDRPLICVADGQPDGHAAPRRSSSWRIVQG